MTDITINIPEEWLKELESYGIDPKKVIRDMLEIEFKERKELKKIISNHKNKN